MAKRCLTHDHDYPKFTSFILNTSLQTLKFQTVKYLGVTPMNRFKRVITLVTLVVCALSLVFANIRQTDAVALEDDVVSTEWLAAHLNDPKVRIIEVSTEPGLFERGHIPGAVTFVWHTDLVNTVVRDIVPQDKFQNLVRAAG